MTYYGHTSRGTIHLSFYSLVAWGKFLTKPKDKLEEFGGPHLPYSLVFGDSSLFTYMVRGRHTGAEEVLQTWIGDNHWVRFREVPSYPTEGPWTTFHCTHVNPSHLPLDSAFTIWDQERELVESNLWPRHEVILGNSPKSTHSKTTGISVTPKLVQIDPILSCSLGKHMKVS